MCRLVCWFSCRRLRRNFATVHIRRRLLLHTSVRARKKEGFSARGAARRFRMFLAGPEANARQRTPVHPGSEYTGGVMQLPSTRATRADINERYNIRGGTRIASLAKLGDRAACVLTRVPPAGSRASSQRERVRHPLAEICAMPQFPDSPIRHRARHNAVYTRSI